jgi:CRISPR system Cascade subunit CasE
MFLSRVPLDVEKVKTAEILCDRGALHGLVESACGFDPSQPRDYDNRRLWRIDVAESGGYLYIVTQDRPENLGKIVQDYGFPNPITQQQAVQIASYDDFLSYLKEGQVFSFRLSAFPSRIVTEHVNGKRVKHRVYIANQLEQLVWLQRYGKDMGGFDVDTSTVRVLSRKMHTIRKSEQTYHYREVTFTGLLTITDVEQFVQALTKGIGRGKAYGLGLLTIVPYAM